MTANDFLQAAPWAIAGFGVGLAYFSLLRRNVDLYVGGARGLGIALHFIRITVTVAAFAGLAALGAAPLILGFLGFVAGRFVSVRWNSGSR